MKEKKVEIISMMSLAPMKYLPGNFIEIPPSYCAIFPLAHRSNEGEEITESAKGRVYSFMMVSADQAH